MHQLAFDVEAAKEQLTQIFRDRISAQGAVYNVFNVDIEAVDFNDIPQPIPNQDKLIADMKTDLKTAQSDGQRWFNEVQPQLTAVPQAVINYASTWNAIIPAVLQQLQQPSPDRQVLQQLFGGLKARIDEQTQSLADLSTALQSIRTAIAGDADNFSGKHASFQQLEDLDKQNLATARTTLDKVKLMIDQYNQEIDVDIIKAEKDLSIASNAMKYGGKLGNPGKIVGLTIGLVFIVSATFAIDDLLAAVDQRLADAERTGEYELELTLLTTQLISLETASTALASLVGELDDIITSLGDTIAGWSSERSAIAAVIADLAGTQPINSILSQFDLGKTQGQWDELGTFATKWQTMEISPKAANDLILGGMDDSLKRRIRTVPRAVAR